MAWPPSPRWRWVLWAYFAMGALWIAGAFAVTMGALAGHHTRVDGGGNLLLLDNSGAAAAWWNAVSEVFFVLLAICWLASLGSQVLSYRRSSGERRQQLKWLMAGSAVAGVDVVFLFIGGSQRPGGWRILATSPSPGFSRSRSASVWPS